MVWIVPAVWGILALTVSTSVRTQEQESRQGSWVVNTSAEVSNEVDTDTTNVDVEQVETSLADGELADIDSDNGDELRGLEGAEEQTEPLSNDDAIWAQEGPEILTEEQQQTAEKIEKAQVRRSLEQQFAKLRKTMETEDAFSLELAEDYFGYGMLLRENGEFEEALKAFVDALHIQKVNHGIYSAEQRPALKALFETHYSLGNVEEFEDYLERILWVESKNPAIQDDFSYKMLIMVGNRYIDQFLRKPIAGQTSVQTLLRAKHHLNAAFKRHKDKPLSVALMPYGELALISFLESQLLDDVDKTASMEDPRLRGSRNLDGRELALASYLSNSFPRGSGLLKSYLRKAQREENLPHVVRALVALGDFNQLFRRHSEAAEYYNLAWLQAQNLPQEHELRTLFSEPTALPSFKYALDRQPVLPSKPTVQIPLLLDIAPNGKVLKVDRDGENVDLKRYFPRARRLARRTIFRPVFVDGKPQAARGFQHSTRVYARKS